MYTTKCLCVLALIALTFGVTSSRPAYSQGQQAWVSLYNGPGNGRDAAKAIAVDSAGNVYVTGASYGVSATDYDYATVKYDAGGHQAWVARYNGPGNSVDEAHAIAVDSAGNVYVTGTSHGGSATDYDYATIKYDPNGNQLWVARYNGPGSASDDASAIAVDAAGSVYVTGHSVSAYPIPTYDIATIKYDAGGHQLWVARYDGPVNDNDSANAIVVDSTGNVYVAGSSNGGASGFDYITIKYNAGGSQLWAARYDGPGSGNDYATGLAVDKSGNVYVTGGSFGGSATNLDYATIKYDPNGNQVWVARYDGPTSADDAADAIALDSAGNVYITGHVDSGTSTNLDYATVKYDTNGNRLWASLYSGPGSDDDTPAAMALDRSGNVYVTGASFGGLSANFDYATVAYDTNGHQLWAARNDGAAHGDDRATAVAVDSAGNVYVTGSSDGSGGTTSSFATIKYGSASIYPVSVQVNPSTIVGGQKGTGTVTLNAAAPPGGVVVVLASDNSVITVPTNVTVPAGAKQAKFTVTTVAVSTVQTGNITATLNGTTASAAVKVRPMGVRSVAVKPNPDKGGKTATGTVTLEYPAAPGDIVVTLTSSDTSVATVPATLTIPAGSTKGKFTITTYHVSSKTTVQIGATANGVGQTKSLKVKP